MKINKQSSGNIVSELISREYGFTDRLERRKRANALFQQNCYGSQFIVSRMKFSHHVQNSSTYHYGVNFKNDRNLICTGNRNKSINIYDWKDGELKYSFKTKHSKDILDVNFLNTNGNGLDIISSCIAGHVRHTCIAPSGNLVSKRVIMNTWQKHKLITVPKSPLEFIAASSNGGIFLTDLRLERWSSRPDKIVFTRSRGFLEIHDIAHHPFAHEICICGRDKSVHIFDKRYLKEAVKELNRPDNTRQELSRIDQCSYNYDGTEILANYVEDSAYLFDNKNSEPGEFLRKYITYDDHCALSKHIKFFGPKSEYILHGSNYQKIYIQDKNTNDIYECSGFEVTRPKFFMWLETHPNLPVIAAAADYEQISIWAPTRLKSNA